MAEKIAYGKETRPLTEEERDELKPVLQALRLPLSCEIRRFVDTEWDKVYNVFLIERNGSRRVLKKTSDTWNEKPIYDQYFAGTALPVPRIYEEARVGEDIYLEIEYVDGRDARACSPQELRFVAKALAEIQRVYLTPARKCESAEAFLSRRFERYFQPLLAALPEFQDVWQIAEKRYRSAPLTLSHDDFLPINALYKDEKAWILDWETAGIRPYFLDLARFAYTSENGKLFLCPEAAAAFIDAYNNAMRGAPAFPQDIRQYHMDVAVSALWWYMIYIDISVPEKQIRESHEYGYLARIADALRRGFLIEEARQESLPDPIPAE